MRRPAEATMRRLSEFVADRFALHFPAERWRELERALHPLPAGFTTAEHYAQELLTARVTSAQAGDFIARLTVGETYFFRESQAFTAVREQVLPALLANRSPRRLRIWCAGCCTGEEPYSLAIFFERECPELRNCEIEILATDLNPAFLRQARTGIYGAWSFRDAPAWLQRDYFRRLPGNRFELLPSIRAKVRFAPLNLAEDTFPAAATQTCDLDLIFCRNVLMYFTASQVDRVIAGFRRALVDGGHLVVGVCEASPKLAETLVPRASAGVTLYANIGSPSDAAKVAGPPPVELDDWLPPEPMTSGGPEQPAADATPPARGDEPDTLTAARDCVRRGDYGSARTLLERRLATAPLDTEAAAVLAQTCANQGQLAEARRWIERALLGDRQRGALHFLRATILQEQGELDLAARAFDTCLYLEANFIPAHVALAELSRRRGRPERARRHLEQARRALTGGGSHETRVETDGLSEARLRAVIDAMLGREAKP